MSKARLLFSRLPAEDCLLTVAIPHYKHLDHAKLALQSCISQDFGAFEILVSDDKSPDESRKELPGLLEESGLPTAYYLQPENLGYDGNVRFCLRAARGRYVFLLGNDDVLNGELALAEVADALRNASWPSVAFTNYAPWTHPSQVVRRAGTTAERGSGPQVALRNFRSFSFVSGLIFESDAARAHETSRWDRSIYYQIYLGARIVAAGGTLIAVDQCSVLKDVTVRGRPVPSFVDRVKSTPHARGFRPTGLDSVARVAVDAIEPFMPPKKTGGLRRQVIVQLLALTYPYWVIEYRRHGGWADGFRVARGMAPKYFRAQVDMPFRDRIVCDAVFVLATAVALLFPVRLFGLLQPMGRQVIRRLLRQ